MAAVEQEDQARELGIDAGRDEPASQRGARLGGFDERIDDLWRLLTATGASGFVRKTLDEIQTAFATT